MHDLAIALHRQGHRITGSDDAFFDPSRSRLEAHGLLPKENGWHPERISPELDRVILGMHAKKDNPELRKAQELGIKIQSFPEFIADNSRDKERVVVTGSHGKTSITAMILHVLHRAGEDSDRLVGAQLQGYEGGVELRDNVDRIVIEGDEYLSSPIDERPKFLWYEPHIALISGIAWDHMNVFPSFEAYLDAFRRFIHSIPQGGSLIYCEEDETLERSVKEEAGHLHCIPYRTHPHRNLEEGTRLLSSEGEQEVRIFGSHNMQNLEGALKVCQCLGIDPAFFYRAIEDFEGAALRLEELHRSGEDIAYRDYAHAPSKVKATVRAVRERYPDHDFAAVLELHTFSSLNPAFIDTYADSMEGADEAYVFFDPKAAEKKGFGELDAARIKSAFNRKDLNVHTDMDALERELLERKASGKKTVLLFMSSGPFQGKDLRTMASRILDH